MTLMYGATGPEVGKVQQQLVEAGYAVQADELGAQRFGMGTSTALRNFQAAHVGPSGHALGEDGILGPATAWALEHPAGDGVYIVDGWRCSPSDARAELVPVMEWAVGQIGEHEVPDGSNRGAKIDEWTGMTGQPAGVIGPPWCAYFVSAALRRCTSGPPFGTLASAMKIHEWARANGRILGEVASVAPMPGDIFVILRGDGHGHVGLIATRRLGDGRVCTVEGNAANAGRGLIRDCAAFSAIVRPLPLY